MHSLRVLSLRCLSATYMMQNMYPVGSLVGLPIMHHIGDKVISCVLL